MHEMPWSDRAELGEQQWPLLCGECPSPASQEGDAPLTPIASSLLDTQGFTAAILFTNNFCCHESLVLHGSGNCVCSTHAAHKTDPSAFHSITINLIFSGMSNHSEELKRILQNINHASLSQQNP